MTLSSDTLILLPIERGSRTANVAFEVRAIDNEGIKDPTPARTVFPIQNSPPEPSGLVLLTYRPTPPSGSLLSPGVLTTQTAQKTSPALKFRSTTPRRL